MRRLIPYAYFFTTPSQTERLKHATYWENDCLLSQRLVPWQLGDDRLRSVGVFVTGDETWDDVRCIPTHVKRHRDVYVFISSTRRQADGGVVIIKLAGTNEKRMYRIHILRPSHEAFPSAMLPSRVFSSGNVSHRQIAVGYSFKTFNGLNWRAPFNVHLLHMNDLAAFFNWIRLL